MHSNTPATPRTARPADQVRHIWHAIGCNEPQCSCGVIGSFLPDTVCVRRLVMHTSQVPPGKDIDAPFFALAKAFHKSYEEKLTAYQDACRNY